MKRLGQVVQVMSKLTQVFNDKTENKFKKLDSTNSNLNATPSFLSICFSSVQFSRSVMSDSLRPHESQHTRPPCPSPSPGVHSDSRPSSQWCHLAISSSVIPFSSCPQSLPASVFSNESTLHMKWPKYWSFSFTINPSKEHFNLYWGTILHGISVCFCSGIAFQGYSYSKQACTLGILWTSTGVSSGFSLPKDSSPYFGSQWNLTI